MAENYYLDDGTYSASQIVIEMVRRRLAGEADISDLLSQLQEPADSREFRLKLQVRVWLKALNLVAQVASLHDPHCLRCFCCCFCLFTRNLSPV